MFLIRETLNFTFFVPATTRHLWLATAATTMKTTVPDLYAFAGATALVQGPWSDVSKTPDERAHALVSEMTLDEKLAMLHARPPAPAASAQPTPPARTSATLC